MATKQRGDLRVIYHRGGSYSLVARATIQGDDVYCGMMGQSSRSEMLRSSYHASGASHTYAAEGKLRLDDGVTVPARDFRGAKNIWSSSPDVEHLAWDYTLRPETKGRINFILDRDVLPDIVSFDIWLLEYGRADVLADLLHGYQNDTWKRFLSMRLLESTTPRIFVVAWTPRDDVMASALAYAEERFGPGGKFTGMVTGPGPPTGPPVQVWPRPEELAENG